MSPVKRTKVRTASISQMRFLSYIFFLIFQPLHIIGLACEESVLAVNISHITVLRIVSFHSSSLLCISFDIQRIDFKLSYINTTCNEKAAKASEEPMHSLLFLISQTEVKYSSPSQLPECQSRYASICGVAVEIRPFDYLSSNSLLRGHCLVGSLTGVVASKSVTEASKGVVPSVHGG